MLVSDSVRSPPASRRQSGRLTVSDAASHVRPPCGVAYLRECADTPSFGIAAIGASAEAQAGRQKGGVRRTGNLPSEEPDSSSCDMRKPSSKAKEQEQ